MESTNNEKETGFLKCLNIDFNINWDWLYLKADLVFALLIFIGMLVFIWWITT